MNPESTEEWAEYIAGLSGEELWSKAVAANSLTFVQDLQEEGKSAKDITDIFIMFGLALEREEIAFPVDMDGQYLSYAALLDSVGDMS